MTIKINPEYSTDYTFSELSPIQFLYLASDVLKKLNCDINYLSDNGIVAHTNNGFLSWNAEIRIAINDGYAKITSISTAGELFDRGKNKENIEGFLQLISQIKDKHLSEDNEKIIEEFRKKLKYKDKYISLLPEGNSISRTKRILSFIIPNKGFTVTPLLIDLNIVLFIIMILSGVNINLPNGISLISWGANIRPAVVNGEYWRLITNIFVHAGLINLLINLIGLFMMGLVLEPIIGKLKLISCFIISGFLASISSILYYQAEISVGTSGAVFGLIGVYIALLTTDIVYKSIRIDHFIVICLFILFNLIFGIKNGIDNASQTGGLISGLIIGFALIPSIREPYYGNLEKITLVYILIGTISISVIVFQTLPNDIPIYEEKMKDFVVSERMAMETFTNQSYYFDSTGNIVPEPKEKIIEDIKTRGLYYWNECLNDVVCISKLSLPDNILEANKELIRYCNLRIKLCNLVCLALEKDSVNYIQDIELCNNQIEYLLNELRTKQTQFKQKEQ